MTRLRKISLVFYIALVLWFTLDLIGVPGFVAKDSLLGIYGVWELTLVAILVGYLLKWKYIDFISGIFLAVWGYLQYTSHWHYLLFGASEKELKGYYRFFSGMYRFFPESQTRLIPDAYHTVLGFLIAVNLVVAVIKMVDFKQKHASQETN